MLGKNQKSSVVNGKVIEVDARSAIVALGDGVTGTLRASERGTDQVEDARTMIKVGDEVEARFTNVDRKNRSVSLSIKAKEVHEEQEALKSYKSEAGAVSTGTTVGVMSKEKMGGAPPASPPSSRPSPTPPPHFTLDSPLYNKSY